MKYIDTITPLESIYLVPEFRSPEEYTEATGLTAPEFDINKPIKRWTHKADNVSTRQVMYDVIAQNEETGVWIYDNAGLYVTELIIMLKTEASQVNIPPRNFNYTDPKHLNLKIYNRPLVPGITIKVDIVRAPDGMSIVARNKDLYKKYIASINNTGGNVEFEKSVLASLAAISLKLGI